MSKLCDRFKGLITREQHNTGPGKREELLRVKLLATSALLVAAMVYVLAKVFEPGRPGLSYVAAFAEAAMIGALADWYAVAALFGQPLGFLHVSIPHTDILRKRKAKIANDLGEFIQDEFLTAEKLTEVIRHNDPARQLASWLFEAANAEKVGAYAVRALRFGMQSLDDHRAQVFLSSVVSEKLKEIDLVRPAGRLLDVLAENRRYQGLLDEALQWLYESLCKEDVKQELIEWVAANIPVTSWFNLDEIVAKQSLETLLSGFKDEIFKLKQDPDHRLRIQFDEAVRTFSDKLKHDQAFGDRLRAFQHEFATHPEVSKYFGGLWSDLKEWLVKDLSDGGITRQQVVDLASLLGHKLAADEEMMAWINEQILRAIPPIVEEHSSKVGRFVAKTVNAWGNQQFVDQVELAIGRDLQFIRLSGTLVGGFVGLALYSGSRVIAIV
jgi:uncharacterized membrane-anchored protein YjiN (DUF445 family)